MSSHTSKTIHFLIWLFLFTAEASAQITIKLDAIPALPAMPNIYLAGNFNGWNPGLASYSLKRDDAGGYSITFTPPVGNMEFKFTMGSWATVESTVAGADIANRKFVYNGTPTDLHLSIAAWKGAVVSTASPSVILLNNQFPVASLHRTRAVWLYLPPSYQVDTAKSYPVVYMLDGQNLFDAALAYAGEWKVDESLDQWHQDQQGDFIVVGIANGESHRLNEYSPWINTQYGGGEGALFLQFITEELKPYIDAHYRTKKEAASTAIAGSSMGGLFSFYAGFQRPDVFSKIGAFSSSFWFSPTVYTWIAQKPLATINNKVYLTAGTAEGSTQVADMLKMRDQLIQKGFDAHHLKADTDAGKGHNENYWAEKFPVVLRWLFEEEATTTQQETAEDNTRWIQCADTTCRYMGPECPSCSIYVSDVSGKNIGTWMTNESTPFKLPQYYNGVLVFSIIQNGKLIHTEKGLIQPR